MPHSFPLATPCKKSRRKFLSAGDSILLVELSAPLSAINCWFEARGTALHGRRSICFGADARGSFGGCVGSSAGSGRGAAAEELPFRMSSK